MNSKIIICNNIRLDKDYINTLNYTEEQMIILCQQNAIASAENYSFLQETGGIYVAFTYNQCIRANYIAYQNPDYSNKWFFAWIDEVIYKGNKNCEIKFTVDAWATWFESLSFQKCFIERQHVTDDTIGLHTIPENLDVGEVIEESEEELFAPEGDPESISYDGSNYYFAIEGTYNPITKKDMEGVCKNNGTLNGNWIFLFKAWDGSVGLPEIRNFIGEVNNASKIESIKNMYILPAKLVDTIGKTKYETTGQVFGNYSFYLLNDTSNVVSEVYNFNVVHSFTNFSPKNNKCFVYPYNYMLATNNIGNYNIYKYEDFYSQNPSFLIEMAVSIGASIRLVPQNYKNIDKNYDESIPLAKFPICSWSADSFTNWLTQNGVNIGTNILLTAGGIGLSVATGGTATPIVSSAIAMSIATTTANTIGQFHKASLLPSITGGNNNGDVNFSARKNTFRIMHMRVKTEYLQIIDDYFTRFGYKINKLENPNINGRRYWNYVEIGKTEEIGHGNIPSKYMEQINNAFRKGVTIWHNHSNIGNYNLNNEIV